MYSELGENYYFGRRSGNVAVAAVRARPLIRARGLSIASRAFDKSLRALWPIRTPRSTYANQDAWAFLTPSRSRLPSALLAILAFIGIIGHKRLFSETLAVIRTIHLTGWETCRSKWSCCASERLNILPGIQSDLHKFTHDVSAPLWPNWKNNFRSESFQL